MEKICTKCKVEKDASQFHLCQHTRSGLQSWCKTCTNKLARPERAQTYLKDWRAINREKILAKKQTQEFKDKRNAAVREQRKKPEVRLLHNLRTRLNKGIQRNSKAASTVDLLGCSIEELKRWLEPQFQVGMSWENYGRAGWHVDHKIPCDKFDMSDPEQQKICFHYTNLQPLWAFDNISKGAR